MAFFSALVTGKAYFFFTLIWVATYWHRKDLFFGIHSAAFLRLFGDLPTPRKPSVSTVRWLTSAATAGAVSGLRKSTHSSVPPHD